MSKFILRKRTSGFTTVSNNVIHVLKGNLEVLGLYLYLLSLPDDWEFYKTHLCKEFSIGIKKLEKLLKILSSFELVQYGQKRNEKGQYETFYIDIYDTETIKINKLENSSPVGQNCRTVKADGRSGEATKEVLQNKQLLKNKENISCSSKSDEPKFFDEFWKAYPRKQKKKDTQKIWKNKKYDGISKILIDDVLKRINSDWKGKNKEFIPLPSSYLNGERWTDEIIEPIEIKKQLIQSPIKSNEIRSTVMEYGPGHPTWESNNAWKLKNRSVQG